MDEVTFYQCRHCLWFNFFGESLNVLDVSCQYCSMPTLKIDRDSNLNFFSQTTFERLNHEWLVYRMFRLSGEDLEFYRRKKYEFHIELNL